MFSSSQLACVQGSNGGCLKVNIGFTLRCDGGIAFFEETVAGGRADGCAGVPGVAGTVGGVSVEVGTGCSEEDTACVSVCGTSSGALGRAANSARTSAGVCVSE